MASMPLPAPDRTLSIGRVLSRAFSAIGAIPGTIFGLFAVFGTIPLVVVHYIQQAILASPGEHPFSAGPLLAVIAGIFVGYVPKAFLTPGVVAYADGERTGFGTCVVAGLPAVIPLIAMSLISTLGFAAGLVLLIVPGVIVYLMWLVAGEAIVIEKLGVMAALKRSQYLTDGARRKMLGLVLLETTAILAATWAIHAVMRLFGQSTTLIYHLGWQSLVAWLIANVVQTTVIGVVGHTIQASLYVELRDWKDGTSSDRLATVFA